MATPYNIWTGLTPGIPVAPTPAPVPMMQGFFPGYPMGPGMGMGWGIPAIPPSSHPMVINPEGAVRDFAEHVLSGDRKNMCTERDAAIIGDWCKNDDYKKIIMEVIKARIDLPWPYNYKTLDLLGSCPLGMAIELIDKIKGLAEAASTVEGSANLHKIGKALLEKAEKEKGKMDEEEAKKRQEAIMAMWGGLWANDGYKVPGGLAQAGWGGWQYPYQMVGPPGVPAQANVEWKSNAPAGWQGSKITTVPQVYPFSRTGYYALIPEDHKPPDPTKAGTFTVSVVPGTVPGPGNGLSKALPLGLDQFNELWYQQHLARGW